jgi:hypothetical protein
LSGIPTAPAAQPEHLLRYLGQELGKAFRTIERLDFRLTVTEQASNTTANAIKELQSSLRETFGDLKLVSEIL